MIHGICDSIRCDGMIQNNQEVKENTLNTNPVSSTEAVLSRGPLFAKALQLAGLWSTDAFANSERCTGISTAGDQCRSARMEAHMTDVSRIERCLTQVAPSPPVGIYTFALKHQKRFDPKSL